MVKLVFVYLTFRECQNLSKTLFQPLLYFLSEGVSDWGTKLFQANNPDHFPCLDSSSQMRLS